MEGFPLMRWFLMGFFGGWKTLEFFGFFTKKWPFYGLENFFHKKIEIFGNLVDGREGVARKRGGGGP